MLTDKRVTGAQALLKVLQEWQADYIFGCPGTTEVPILDALVDKEKPSFILVPQEGVAVSAADGYARVTGKPGVASLHANVGLANGVSQVYAAQMAGVPLVVLNAIKQRSILSHGAFTAAHDHQEMIRQYTKWDWMCLRPEELRQDLRRAFQVALQPPAGPAYLALPQDVLEAIVTGEAIYPEGQARPYRSRPAANDIRAAAALLAGSKFPLILVGGGMASRDCLPLVRDLAGALGCGVCCENRLALSYNAYPTGESHFLGPYNTSHPVLSAVDVILAVGTRLFVEFQPPAQPWIPVGAQLIHIHDAPDEIGRLYHPAVGLCGSVRDTLEELISILRPLLEQKAALVNERNLRVAQLHLKRNQELALQLDQVRHTNPIKVARLAQAIGSMMDEATTVVVDAATSNDVFVEYLPRPNALSYFSSATGGSLGWGMGAALGIKLGVPERKVITILGDGVFMFGIPALWTAQKYNLPVVFIVINNGSYAAVKAGLIRHRGRAAERGVFPATDISGTDYAQVARGFGLLAEKITDPRNLESAIHSAVKSNKPFLLEVLTDPEDVGRLAR